MIPTTRETGGAEDLLTFVSFIFIHLKGEASAAPSVPGYRLVNSYYLIEQKKSCPRSEAWKNPTKGNQWDDGCSRV